ncbi:hypothetical protein ACS0TY_028672 [Phlomoides rotata]
MEMQALLPYLLPLLLLPLSLYLVSFIGRTSSDDEKNLPPGSKGWPMLGENRAFSLFGPQKFVKDRMEKYSPDVFKTSLFGEKMVIFCGAQGNKFFFSNDTKALTAWHSASMKKVLMFPDVATSNMKEMSMLKRTFRLDMLKPEALKQYIPIMDAMAREQMDSDWKPDSVVKVVHLSKKYTFELACRLFLGVVDAEDIKKLSDPFTLVTEGMLSLPLDFPGTAYSRALKGGKVVREELKRIVKQRRKELMGRRSDDEEGQDMLSKMLLVRDEDGELFNEMEICNSVIGLLIASFDTTSSAVTSVMNYLAQLPHIYENVFKEQMEVAKSKGPDELLTWEDIEKMKYSWNVARESLRLTPSSQGGLRETTTDVTYAGFTIPKGWKVSTIVRN